MKYDIRHNDIQRRFEALISNEIVGFVDYILSENGIIEIPHTEVQRKFEGLGIAGKLTEALLSYAMEQNLKVKPICPYAVAYFERHSEYKILLE